MAGANIKSLFAKQRAATAGVVDAVEQVRLQIIVAQDQRQQIERLPVDRQRAIDALDQGIADAASMLDTRMLVAGLTRPSGGQPHFEFTRIPENLAGAWLATLVPDRLRDHFMDEIAAFYDDRDDLPEAERGAEIARLDAETLAAELVEEKLIRMSEAAGIPVLRRGDADPRAALAADASLPG